VTLIQHFGFVSFLPIYIGRRMRRDKTQDSILECLASRSPLGGSLYPDSAYAKGETSEGEFMATLLMLYSNTISKPFPNAALHPLL